ncbi:MAG: YSIRK-type signal peptide-containing protein [Lactobacillus sp.]|nr:YSIRK-type signal peptide-containing protein [Lactobacillus sp.]
MKKINNFKDVNQRQHFSIRKLSIGAVSVLLSTSFYLGVTSNTTHADTVATTQDTDQQNNSIYDNKTDADNAKSTIDSQNQATKELSKDFANTNGATGSQKTYLGTSQASWVNKNNVSTGKTVFDNLSAGSDNVKIESAKNSDDSTKWTITFNQNGGVKRSDKIDSDGTSAFGILISKDLNISNIQYGASADSLQSISPKSGNNSISVNNLNNLTFTQDYQNDNVMKSFDDSLQSGDITSDLKINSSDFATTLTFDPWNGAASGQTVGKKNSKSLVVSFTTTLNPSSDSSFSGVLAAERYMASDLPDDSTATGASSTISAYSVDTSTVTYPTAVGVESKEKTVTVNTTLDKDKDFDLSYKIDKAAVSGIDGSTATSDTINSTSDQTLYTVEKLPVTIADGQGTQDDQVKSQVNNVQSAVDNSLSIDSSSIKVTSKDGSKILSAYATTDENNNIIINVVDKTILNNAINSGVKNTTNYKLANDAAKANYDAALEAANNILQKSNASQTDVDNAKAALQTALDALDGDNNLASAKNDAISKINALNNLNDAQKAAAISSINNETDPDNIDNDVSTATTLDGSMGNLASDSALTTASDVENSSNFKNADPDKQKAYTDAVQAANDLIAKTGDNADNDAVKAAQTAVDNALNALNGDSNLANAKSDAIAKIEALNNLNDAQKKAAEDAINAETDASKISSYVDTATTLDGSMGNLASDSALTTASDVENSSNFKNADPDKQKAYTDAVQAANDLIAKTGANADNDAVKAAQTAVDNALSALNGDSNLANTKSDAIAKIEALNNLNDAQKKAAEDAINAETDASKISSYVDTATTLDDSMNNLASDDNLRSANDIESSNNFKNADEDKQQAYLDAVKTANDLIAKTGANDDNDAVQAAKAAVDNALKALNGDAKLADAKKDALAKIAALKNLNDAQKKAAEDAINAETDPSKLDDHVTTATTLDGSMGELASDTALTTASDVENSSNFKNADPDKQKAYLDAVKAANDLLAKIGANDDNDAVQAAKTAVDNALKALNGDTNLASAKNDALAKIDALKNLNDAQKATAKAAINNETDASKISGYVTTANTLDSSMGNLASDTALTTASNVQNSSNFKNADADKQKAYLDAVKAANDLLAKTGANADNDAVKAAQAAIDNALKALNGDTNLASAKNDAIAKINGMTNLNNKQKADLINQVNGASAADQLNTIVDNANKSNDNMAQLATKIAELKDIKNSDKYKNADADKKKAYDTALQNAIDLANSDAGADVLTDGINEVTEALVQTSNKLNGKTTKTTNTTATKKVSHKNVVVKPHSYKKQMDKLPSRVESNKLPQTGDNTLALAIMGALMSVGSLVATRRKKED